jgi:alpha-D-ribose 1-methylphosphonate 5-triphosphate diphosphatase PhnM
MPGNFYIFNARIVNEGEIFVGSLIIRDGLIRKIIRKGEAGTEAGETSGLPSLDAGGKILIPGAFSRARANP